MVSRFASSVRRGSGAGLKSTPIPEDDAPLASSSAGLKELLEEPLRCSVKVASYTAMNWGGRHANEDRTMIANDVLGEQNLPFHTVGVLDGHDTESASDLVARNLPDAVARRFKADLPIIEAYVDAMAEMEESLKKVHATAGTCVNSCTIAGGVVWCANLGDCRAALVVLEEPASAGAPAKAVGLQWMSRDHKASCPYEKKRIEGVGGTVTDGRVEGLEPSRTLGDFDVKLSTKPGVISIVPEVRQFNIRPGESSLGRRAVLLCGTDGVWDVLTGQDVCKLIHARKDLGTFFTADAINQAPDAGSKALADLAEDIVQFAVAKGSRDDCTCVAAMITVMRRA
eukprot:TRINITY_DN49600_c0_g1_i1.p1 TRINITY_DN49600_c0_g1~~TRINITY_DN49600_c0_g1_i1.p1  ORF type:complete len:341 (+),score=41.32 TRINITY_DN49600_c0_g1_i1:159-1181(+)